MTTAAGTKTSVLRRTELAAAIAAIGLAGAANAFADPVDLTVVNRDTGQPLRVWRHDGRLFVAGEPGTRYSLRVTNHTRWRVLVVLSVDGVNILSGETAGYDQRGYIFKPNESFDLDGWRKSQQQIAAFVFAPLPQSYAARTGRPVDVGVIGMAVFKEKAPVAVEAYAPPPARRDRFEESSHGGSRAIAPPQVVVPSPMTAPVPPPPPPPPAALAAQSSRAAPETVVVTAEKRSEKLGTAYGELEASFMPIEPFERATSYPQFVKQIEYDTYDNLVASGVIQPSWNEQHRPRPFPAKPDGAGYVPDPPPEP